MKDQSGAVVPNATVEVASPALIGTKKAQTDAVGYYRFSNLPPGEYTLAASAPGFRAYKQTGIALEVGRLPNIDVQLQVGAITQLVEVSQQAPLVDTAQSKVAVTIPLDVLQNIPKGRSFQSLIPYAPGARQEPLQSRGRGSNGFQIDGASDSENSYLVEGMDTTDIQNGGLAREVPMEFIQEVQVKSSGFDAEYGALGGVVNVIQKRGGNAWHGDALLHYRSDGLNATDQCAFAGTVASIYNCGLRSNPAFSFSAASRVDAPVEQYIAKKDHQRIIDPGFDLGGDIKRDKLWLFTSYVPTFDRFRRSVNFTGANPGLRTFKRTIDTHNAWTRLDWLTTEKIRTFVGWQYGYARSRGTDLPLPDSILGQANTDARTDPATFRPERGTVSPNSVYNFGGDITLNPRLILTARFGYWFTNVADRGTSSGIRYFYTATAVGVTGLDGTPLPSQFQQRNGFQNIASNQKTFFDVFTRRSLSMDASYFKTLVGTHNFKFGYGFNRLSENVFRAFDGALVRLTYGDVYGPLDPNACGVSGKPPCRGNFGYYIVRDGVDVQGRVATYNHYIYAQDSWMLGKGVTLNLGVRLDKENLPPYVPGAPAVNFGWTDKVAPRLGAAWDVLRNGKLKLYGSFGKFYDIMKYSLPRGSFGGEYWHDCAYTLDDPDFNKILPAVVNGHSCPGSGGASGSVTGQFIENVNYRSVVINPADPGVDPNLKPMRQHAYDLGVDYAFTPRIGLEVRYTRKRLDDTIEDVGIPVTGNELYYIGNPGKGIVANLLQRTTVDSSNVPILPPTAFPPQCPDCPLSPKAFRNYDGLEFRVIKQATSRWFGAISYTYSRLYGNYGGLTSTEITDGGGGRHSPNNSRYFDLPNMAWTAHGTPDFGPLGTDRPHALKVFTWYRLKWLGQESTFGFEQQAYSGTPLSTCWPEVSTQSSCSFVEGHGNFVALSQAPGGDIALAKIRRGFRSPRFTQTDFSFIHEFKVSKTNEALRLALELNVSNLFNQHHVLALFPTVLAGGRTIVTPRIGGGATGATDWHALTDRGFDYIAASNVQRKTVDNRYGLPNLFQPGREMRLSIRFRF